MKRMLFVLATVMSLPFAEAGIRPFADGERIAFLGDSITHGGGYVADLQVAWKVRHPGSRPVFLNAGIGGDTAKRGFDRVETDLATMRPDRVVVMFGMNDVNTGRAYFEEWMTKLCDALDAKGWKVDLMTPTPYDEWNTNLTAKVSKPRQEPALGDCAAFVRELAAKRGYGLVELHDPLVRILKENPERRYLADRVHPGESGHRIIAARILEAAGEGEVGADEVVPKNLVAARDRLLAVQRKRRTLAEYERTLREQKVDPDDRAAAFAALDRRLEDLRKRIPAADAKWHEGQQRMFKETLYGKGPVLEAEENASRRAIWMETSPAGEVVLENARFRLSVGDDATVRSLVVKATGEDCAAAAGEIPLFTVTQERPFDNELKLIHPNRRTAFRATSLKREGNRLKVGFEIVPYVATVEVRETDAYVELKLLGFSTNYYDHCNLRLDKPPAVRFRVVQLPVKDRRNFGNWLNASWDGKAAIGVVSTSPHPDIDNERRPGYRILTADLVRGRRFRGGSAAIVVANGREDFLDCMDRLETDFDLPRGVRSRRSGHLNGSIYHGLMTMGPTNIDQHIAWAKKGGFRYMCLPTEVMVKTDGEWGFHGDYDWRDDYPNREADLREMLGKIKAAGIIPGIHFLTTHVGLKSRYVTPVADSRLNVTRRFTLVKPLPAGVGTNVTFELAVQEPTEDSPRADGIRILKFGGELLSYESYTTEPPYRFLGVRRGAHRTNVVAHPAGEVGGILDVSEYGTPTSCYADQDSDLPEEIGAKIASFYNCGFEFAYFDGAEGVNVPCGYHVSNAQYRQYRQFGTAPLFCEGAAKSHFGWHILSGANAFDCFLPGEFKRMTAKFPFGQAPLAWQDMTRCNFGWWFFWKPDERARPDLVTGTQMDMWEYGQALSFAWDCPTTVLMDERIVAAHPRADDILETMRRWEDARVKQPFTAEEKESLKDASQEHHLCLNERGGYELVKSEMLPAPAKAPFVRGFLFERKGRRVLAFWHLNGAEEVEFDFGDGVKRERVADLRYHETPLSCAEARAAYARMTTVGFAGL